MTISGVLVLAAGKSSRIAEVAGGAPKPLLPIAGKPVLGRNLEWLAEEGVTSVWINLHHRADAIREAIGDGRRFNVAVRYSEEPQILGTAGAWKRLEQHWSGTSLVVYGDNLLRFDLTRFQAAHRASGLLGTLALFDPARHLNTGIAGGHVELDGPRVRRFVEGPRPSQGGPHYVNAGVYLLEPQMRAAVGPGFQDFGRDVFPALVATGQLAGYVLEPEGYCLGIDTPASLATARELVEHSRVDFTS
ncbi:MAG: nucleotidyltransferase family protein [Gemmatimonadales bacterium]